jgi:hypothetical protein
VTRIARPTTALYALATLAIALTACSADDGSAGAASTSPTTPAPATTPSTTPVVTARPEPSTVPPSRASAPTTAPPATVDPAATPAPADTGVPGLDSDDAFCAAWSRFGGSWQVTLAAAAFGPADDAARLEVLASTVVADAYDAIFLAWPAELESEREVVADEFFGAFRRRSADALAALSEAGADDDDIAELADLWVDALAGRDPGNPVLEVDVPEELAGTVVAAVGGFTAQRPPFTQDPSMVITASTPLTDDYLQTACPDQGSIFGENI